MKTKKIPLIIITIVIVVAMLTINAFAYYFVVGGLPVEVSLSTNDPAVAEIKASQVLTNVSISISGSYIRANGTVGTASKSINGQSGEYLYLELDLPDDGIRWINQVVATFSASYNGDTGGTSITKILH